MNILDKTYCYTIGNLEYDCFDFAEDWRSFVKKELSPLGIKILSPLDKIFTNYPIEDKELHNNVENLIINNKENEVRNIMKEIRRRDLSACDYSTFLIAVINTQCHTVGSYEEIFRSLLNNKPIFFHFIGKNNNYKLNVPKWIRACVPPDFFYPSIAEIVKDIKKIDKGEKEINPKYWKILEK